MSDSNITKLDVAAIDEAITLMNGAIEDFQGYDKKYLQQMGQELDSFQSDFASKAQDLLKSMEDTVAPKMTKKIEKFTEGLQVVRDLLVQVDDTSAEAFDKK